MIGASAFLGVYTHQKRIYWLLAVFFVLAGGIVALSLVVVLKKAIIPLRGDVAREELAIHEDRDTQAGHFAQRWLLRLANSTPHNVMDHAADCLRESDATISSDLIQYFRAENTTYEALEKSQSASMTDLKVTAISQDLWKAEFAMEITTTFGSVETPKRKQEGHVLVRFRSGTAERTPFRVIGYSTQIESPDEAHDNSNKVP